MSCFESHFSMDGLQYMVDPRTTEMGVCSRISQFACNETIESRLLFLDQELSVFGYPSIQTSNNSLNIVTLVNIVHDLLQIYRKSLRCQSDAKESFRSCESEVLRIKRLLSSTKDDLTSKQSELNSKCLQESQLSRKVLSSKNKIKIEQEKARKVMLDMTSRDSQFKHEKKKLQQQIDRLQEKLQKLLQDKRKENFCGFQMLNTLQRADGSRGKWATDKSKKSNENDMYRIIMENYEDAQNVLLKENHDIRKYLKHMQDQINDALKEKKRDILKNCGVNGNVIDNGSNSSFNDESKYGSSTSSDDAAIYAGTAAECVFSMPYDIVKDEIESSLSSKLQELRKFISGKNVHLDNESSLSEYHTAKVTELEKIIRQQKEAIRILTSKSDDGKTSKKKGAAVAGADMHMLKETAELEKKRALFEEQRLNMNKEKKDFAKGVAKLNEDRVKFENIRCSWLKNHFFQKTISPCSGDPSSENSSTNFSVSKHKRANEEVSSQSVQTETKLKHTFEDENGKPFLSLHEFYHETLQSSTIINTDIQTADASKKSTKSTTSTVPDEYLMSLQDRNCTKNKPWIYTSCRRLVSDKSKNDSLMPVPTAGVVSSGEDEKKVEDEVEREENTKVAKIYTVPFHGDDDDEI